MEIKFHFLELMNKKNVEKKMLKKGGNNRTLLSLIQSILYITDIIYTSKSRSYTYNYH